MLGNGLVDVIEEFVPLEPLIPLGDPDPPAPAPPTVIVYD
jgi:hypothetical protein